jgi:hypothetical protein
MTKTMYAEREKLYNIYVCIVFEIQPVCTAYKGQTSVKSNKVKKKTAQLCTQEVSYFLN